MLLFCYCVCHLYVGNEYGQEEPDEMEPSSSCSSPGEYSYEGEDWSLELTDDSSDIDGEVGKRLNQMVPIPVSSCILLKLTLSKI